MTSGLFDGAPDPCLDIVTVIEGFFRIEKRSETLDGSIPLRAAQGCKPLLDGNAAGFQVKPAVPAIVRESRSGAKLVLGDEGYAIVSADYSRKIGQHVDRGFIRRDGPWHRELLRGIAWQKKGVLHLWTGHLVRPAAGVCVLVSGAWNRRCLVNLVEHVIPDDCGFVPLILRLDLASLDARDTWLDTELACLTPLCPRVAISRRSLQERAEIGRAYCEFYDSSYLEPRARGEYIGRYRRVTSGETESDGAEPAECELVVAGRPAFHRIGTFDYYATADGWSRRGTRQNAPQYAIVRSICEVSGRWDGLEVRDIKAEMPEEIDRLRRDWTALYGADHVACIDAWFAYALGNLGPQRGEPYMNILPWVFAVTPRGWSSVIDACHVKTLAGLRGVVSTDRYFSVPPVWQFHRPGRFEIARGAALARVLPVPRRLLRAGFRNRHIDDAAADDLD